MAMSFEQRSNVTDRRRPKSEPSIRPSLSDDFWRPFLARLTLRLLGFRPLPLLRER